MFSKIGCWGRILRFGNSPSSIKNELFAAGFVPRSFSTDLAKPSSIGSMNKHAKTLASSIANDGFSALKSKANSVYKSYEIWSHMDEIRGAHQNVEMLQEELKSVQQRRREVSKELNDIRYELRMLSADLASCQRGEPKFLELIRKEYDVSSKK